ncbi:MAG: amidohydrolase family protein [Opitutaceae bacterium]
MGLIVDCHVHLYPVEIAGDPAGWSSAHAESHWSRLVLPSDGKQTLQGWADVDGLLREMDRSGIDRGILQGWYWQNQETCEILNRFYADCLRRYPDRLSAFATVQPASGKRALDAIRRSRDQGFLGLGELCPPVQGGFLRDADWRAAMELAASEGLVVLFHVDEQVGRPHPGRVSTPLSDFQWVLEELPDLRVILAHLGGGMVFHRMNRAMRPVMDRLWFDTAAAPLIYDPSVYAAAVACGVGDRLLFGSDYPLITFPRRSREPDLVLALEEIRGTRLTEEEKRRILGGNAAALFGFPG